MPQVGLEDDITQYSQRFCLPQLFPGWQIFFDLHLKLVVLALFVLHAISGPSTAGAIMPEAGPVYRTEIAHRLFSVRPMR